MNTIIDFIVNNDFVKTVVSVVNFILNLPKYIINAFSSLPGEITTLLSTALIIIVMLFLYRLIK